MWTVSIYSTLSAQA